jgi:hypothetical protein
VPISSPAFAPVSITRFASLGLGRDTLRPDDFVKLIETGLAADFPWRTSVDFHFVSGLAIGVVGNKKACVDRLVRRLHPACEVDRVADHGPAPVFSPTDAPRHDCPIVKSDSDLEASPVKCGKVRFHRLDGAQHLQPGLKSSRDHALGLIETEDDQHAIAHVVVDDTAVAFDDPSNLIVIAIESVDYVVGQQFLCERR